MNRGPPREEQKMPNQTVASFDLGFTNSALRMPYALAKLTCGHVTDVKIKPTLYACGECGRETTSCQHASCPCGSTKSGFRFLHIANPHLPEDRITQIGDEVECKQCEDDIERIAWLRALPKGLVHHARFDPRFSPGSYHLYKLDQTSPSCFFLIGSVPATKQFDEVLREVSISPISPTEVA
jgi:hypothetical protein